VNTYLRNTAADANGRNSCKSNKQQST